MEHLKHLLSSVIKDNDGASEYYARDLIETQNISGIVAWAAEQNWFES